MSVSFTDLRGFTAMSETMAPENVRSTMNDYLEAIISAIDDNQATVDKIIGDEVMALYGAPRYFSDHALRAVITACGQIRNLKDLQQQYQSQGKVMPACGIGINSGDMVVGNMGSSSRQDYTVLGATVNLAARLCGAAKGMEVIITEPTLISILEHLPKGWTHRTNPKKKDISSEGVGGKIEGVFDLSPELKHKVIGIGPDKGKDDFVFRYLYTVQVKGVKEPVPVIAVEDLRSELAVPDLQGVSTPQNKGERIFGKYRLIEKIGQGGMGEVWKARDPFGNQLAIKLLLAGDAANETQIKRFKREAEVMSRLQHRNLCRIYEVGEIEKQHYIAMEYIDGVSLSKILQLGEHASTQTSTSNTINELVSRVAEFEKNSQVGTQDDEECLKGKYASNYILPNQQSLSIIRQVCESVQYTHEKGILHRDLKPGNIMIRPNGEAVVMDFGLAKLETSNAKDVSLSISGQIVGTMEYMAPEQAQNSKYVDERSDIYSIGAIFYQLVCGKRHFSSSGNLLSDANTLATYTPPAPRSVRPDLAKDLEVIILKALRYDLNDRYRSAQALLEDIEHYQRGEPIGARHATPLELAWKWCGRNKALASTLFASAIILIVGSVIFMINLNLERNRALEAEQLALNQKNKALAAEEQAQAERKNAVDAQKKAEHFLEVSEQNNYANQIGLAAQYVKSQDIGIAKALLDSCEPRFRHWEWHHLKYMTRDRSSLVLKHNDTIHAMDSHQQKLIITGGQEKVIRLWSTTSTKPIHSISIDSTILDLKFSRDGSQFLVITGAHQLLTYETQTGKPLMRFSKEKEEIHFANFSRDGQRLISTSKSNKLMVWKTQDGSLLKSFPTRFKNILSFSVHPDGSKTLLLGRIDHFTVVSTMMDNATGKELHRKQHKTLDNLVMFSRDGSKYMVGKLLFDSVTHKQLQRFSGQDSLLIGQDIHGDHIVTAHESGMIRSWGIDHQYSTDDLNLSHLGATLYHMLPDGKSFLIACRDQNVRLMNFESHEASTVISTGKEIYNSAFSQSSEQLISTRDNFALVQNLNGEILQRMSAPIVINDMAPHPDGKRLLIICMNGYISLRSLEDPQFNLNLTPKIVLGSKVSCAISPDGQYYLIGSKRHGTLLWDTHQQKTTMTTKDMGAYGIDISQDSRYFAIGDWAGQKKRLFITDTILTKNEV
jgi:serine/threonine protein kinase/class 3 adenylate cyclase